MANEIQWKDSTLAEEVRRRAGAAANACLQCHKCSTGCPVAPEMDILPSQAMRLIQLGQEEELLESRTIWLCASCSACSTRCPMAIDVAGAMDALRMLAIERKAELPDKRVQQFNETFLNSVRRHGRVFELGMMMAYKLKSGDLFSDVDKAPKMFAKGKLSLLPHGSASAGQTRAAFERADQEEPKR